MKEMQHESITAGDNVLLADWNKLTGIKNVAKNNICVKLYNLCESPKGSAFHQLQQFRKMVPDLIKAYCEASELNQNFSKQFDRILEKTEKNKNKRWTEEEENWLIDLVVNDTPIIDISTAMGRSPSAIKSKVSNLVGLKRISQNIAGKFFGTINGEEVTGLIKGTVCK